MNGKRCPAWLVRPWWLGLAVTLMGGLWIRGAYAIASTTGYIGLGPGAMVLLAGAGLTVCGLILTVQALRGRLAAPEPDAPTQRDAGTQAGAGADCPPSPGRAFALAAAGVGLPLLTIGWLGFPLTATLVFALVARAFGARRTGRNLALGALLAGLVWWGFSGLGISLGAFLPFLPLGATGAAAR